MGCCGSADRVKHLNCQAEADGRHCEERPLDLSRQWATAVAAKPDASLVLQRGTAAEAMEEVEVEYGATRHVLPPPRPPGRLVVNGHVFGCIVLDDDFEQDELDDEPAPLVEPRLAAAGADVVAVAATCETGAASTTGASAAGAATAAAEAVADAAAAVAAAEVEEELEAGAAAEAEADAAAAAAAAAAVVAAAAAVAGAVEVEEELEEEVELVEGQPSPKLEERPAPKLTAVPWPAVSPEELELGEQLGGGGAAVVYAAEWAGRSVAVKLAQESADAVRSPPSPPSPSGLGLAVAGAGPLRWLLTGVVYVIVLVVPCDSGRPV